MPQVRRFHWDKVLTVAGGHLVHDAFSAFLSPLLPLLIDKLGLSLTLAGSLSAVQRLPSLLNPLIGAWADRIDLRLLVVLAPSVTACAMSLMGLAPSYAAVVLLLLAAGISSAALHVPGPVIISRAAGDKTGMGMSFWMMGGELARTLGPLAAVAVVSWLTLEGYYPVMVIGLFASLVLYLRLRDMPLRAHAQSGSAPLRESWLTLRRLMVPLIVIMALRSLMMQSLATFLPTYLTGAGESLWFAGRGLAVVELAGALGALASGTLSDRLGRRWVLFGALVGAPLLLLLFLSLRPSLVGSALQFALLAPTGLLALSTTPVIMALVQDHGRERPATANGIYMGSSFVIGALASLLVGGAGDLVGLETAFAGSAWLALLSAPLVWALPPSRPRPPSS